MAGGRILRWYSPLAPCCRCRHGITTIKLPTTATVSQSHDEHKEEAQVHQRETVVRPTSARSRMHRRNTSAASTSSAPLTVAETNEGSEEEAIEGEYYNAKTSKKKGRKKEERQAQRQKYQPYARDPSLSGAFATYFWELTLLSKHYHPTISTIASGISTISNSHDQVYRENVSPEHAFTDMKVDQETFVPKGGQKSNNKRKRGSKVPPLVAAGG